MIAYHLCLNATSLRAPLFDISGSFRIFSTCGQAFARHFSPVVVKIGEYFTCKKLEDVRRKVSDYAQLLIIFKKKSSMSHKLKLLIAIAS